MLLLLKMELSVGELAVILDQSQPRISRHIRILDEARLAERRKEGSWVFLRPGPASELDVLRRIFRSDKLSSAELALSDEGKLSEVRESRAAMAEKYFAAHAAEWDAIRSLHIAETEVEHAMHALLSEVKISHLLDIGTGTGRMIELFGLHAQKVTAVDKSPEMLRLARAKLLSHDGPAAKGNELTAKTELKIGDFGNLPVEDNSVDCIILHQVLHYAQHPEAVLSEVARVLKREGTLLIADFAAHDREDLRTTHAHARLGFSDESMMRWFNAVRLDMVQCRTLDGGELTVKIWVGRKTNLTHIRPKDNEINLPLQNKKRATI
jgi:ArsR family transcriptional regulator